MLTQLAKRLKVNLEKTLQIIPIVIYKVKISQINQKLKLGIQM